MNKDTKSTELDSEYYSLIDRLQRHSEWKYPNRLWSKEFYDNVAFLWKNKRVQLEEQVNRFENDMKQAGAL